MKVLIDTNVLIDFILTREPYADDAENILTFCKNKKITNYITSHSIMNIFYILRKEYTLEDRRSILLNLCKILDVIGIDSNKIENALKNEKFSDMEDCLQSECADSSNSDYIITRNIKDFRESKVPAIEPDKFLQKIK